MEATGASTARPGRGRPAIEAGDHGPVTTRVWVIDKTTGRPRRRRTTTTPQRKADSKRLPTAYWTAETYVNTDQGLRRVQARGTTRDAAVIELASKLRGPEHDLLAQAIAEETGHGTTFTDRTTLGRVLDAWIADATTTRTRSGRHHRPLPTRHHPQHQSPLHRLHHPRPGPPRPAHPRLVTCSSPP